MRLLGWFGALVLAGACGGASTGSAGSNSGSGSGDSRPRDAADETELGFARGESMALSVAAIVHAPTGLAFISKPGSGIAAVRLETGETIWTSEAGDRPLAANGEVVVAQEAPGTPRSDVHIAILRVSDGTVLTRSEPITLPDWVVPRPWNNGATYAFDSDAVIEGEVATFRWSAGTRRYCGGMESSTCQGTDASSIGAARIDLASGEVTPAPAPRTLEGPPAPPAVALLGTALASSHFEFARTVVGDELVGTTLEDRNGRRVLSMARFDAQSAEQSSSIDLTAPGSDEAGYSGNVPRFSVDGRHLVVTRLRMRPPPPEYTRTIHDTTTGDSLGDVSLGQPARPYVDRFVVVGEVLVQVDRAGPEYDPDRDAALVGVGVADGTERFRAAVRQVHGHSLPPSAPPPSVDE